MHPTKTLGSHVIWWTGLPYAFLSGKPEDTRSNDFRRSNMRTLDISSARANCLKVVITRAGSAFIQDGVNTFIFELGAATLKRGINVHILTGFCPKCMHARNQLGSFVVAIYVSKESPPKL